MSYLVLARKWRPQTFEEVMGQAHVTRTLQNALKKQRLAHAFLFSGPRGVGKTSVARILARAINCGQGMRGNPCNACETCNEITSGSAVDVLEIDGASNRGIDEIRQLRETIRFRPVCCPNRVYIIDEVHMLTKEAFNALLKTLEEPPPHVFFIFATTEPHKVPPTIHSRCQHYGFRRLKTRELADHLDRIVEAEAIPISRDATFMLAREAGGSVRDALSLLDQVAAFGAETADEVCEALGVVNTRILDDLSRTVLGGDAASALRIVGEVYNHGIDLQKFLADFVLSFRDLVVLRAAGPEASRPLVDIPEDGFDHVSGILSLHTSQDLLQRLEVLARGQDAMHRSRSPRLTLEILLLRACALGEVVGIESLLERLEEVLSGREVGTCPQDRPTLLEESPPPALKSVPATGSPPLPKELTSATWNSFAEHIRAHSPPLASKLQCCSDVRIDGNAWEVSILCSTPLQKDLLGEPESVKRLNELALAFFGRAVNINMEIAPSSSSGKDDASSTQPVQQSVLQSPLVKGAMEIFQARVAEIDVSRKGREKPREAADKGRIT